MGDRTGIEWTDATWNPQVGCSRVSRGCQHCYAETQAAGRLINVPAYHGVTTDGRFNGTVNLLPERLDQPIRWRRPRRIFVNSMSDLFHENVPDKWIARVFAVMSTARQHTYQVLTKRPERMAELVGRRGFRMGVRQARYEFNEYASLLDPEADWPLPNVWLGTSVENQRTADERIPHLLSTPAAVRFLSVEPLVGPVDLGIGDPHRGHESDDVNGHPHPRICLDCSTEDDEVEYFRRDIAGEVGLGWVIVGGESGKGAAPMHPDWVRSIRDECVDAGVPFLFKQWGEWRPHVSGVHPLALGAPCCHVNPTGSHHTTDNPGPLDPGAAFMLRVGKKAAGRQLDGRTWDEYPEAVARA
jgi:protein gp37